MDLNKVQLIGRITQDVELKQTPSGQNVTTLSVATNRTFTDGNGVKQDTAEFHSIVLWGKLAEIAGNYLQKWKKVYIEWRIQTRSWEAQDGTKRYKTEIVWENMIMLDNAWSTDTSQSTTASTGSVRKTSPKVEEEISIEDIPF